MSDELQRIHHEGKVYKPAPELVRHKCIGCAIAIPNIACSSICRKGAVLIEDTPEGLARYIALRMTI